MHQTFDLATLDWTLTGWHPRFWRPHCSMETNVQLLPDIGPLTIKIPGSVQQALRAAEILPDWQHGLNSRSCEWVEHRHWVYEADLPDAWLQADRLQLDCAGLDYQGYVFLNGKEIGTFKNTFVPHAFELTPFLSPSGNHLALVFTENPFALGQVGYTSETSDWKARFYYVWDFTPRIVQTGIWDRMSLTASTGDAIDRLSLYTEYGAATQRGAVVVRGACRVQAAAQVEVLIVDETREIIRHVFPISDEFTYRVEDCFVAPWQPNGAGTQQRYTVTVRLLDTEQQVLDATSRQVGFRQIAWLPCANAPADAEPWICSINGTPTFLQGINWVPIRATFADVTDAEYRQRLTLYRDAGCNLIRVWGGAVLEKEIFYDLCDELGLLVWQEFPQCSSWLENWPSEDATRIAEISEIARSYIARRQHHPALLMWCGGNELQGAIDGGHVGVGKPIDRSHPMMATIEQLVQADDPTRRFTPTSPLGPTFYATEEAYGQGVHQEVHGPWNYSGAFESWQAYWDHDDALFRSEVGMPGSSALALIQALCDGPILPADATNLFWKHSAANWLQWQDYLADGGDPEAPEAYVAWSQHRQAQALGYAASACQRRFPAIGGIIFWMGHDTFPTPLSLSLIDAAGNPKPAFHAIAEVFQQTTDVAALTQGKQ